ncbi:hexose kinase [Mammaliicoccus sciuri]|uniref:1-phosphofructokinase family hexose kinase n=1 Tax=Mammaliicoccus sciuri TaxID=1296 RepID=UPI0021D3242E|nr:hexose kinase [Mammaliicoccus sciuri]UXU82711.1 hexose kinase [Mammaliicoccus sciuri]UXU92557.1 hexose kinase [Mammaliicoccus sciuri]UXV14458.1 hexose kinase [Mammaliicoccus sciuri]UXV22772.1 hexose kinase [Mammaliicoccus sciuri]UXV25502.1 hexose kinase [Mammaliicoccus sciuri]
MKLLTITLNTSVDIAYQLDHFELNQTNRVKNVIKTAGGKGLNVTRVANVLGIDHLATGIIGGTTGEFIKRDLDQDHIKHDFYETNIESRQCFAILNGAHQTELLEPGDSITQEDIQLMIQHVTELIQEHDIIAISGSALPGMNVETYQTLIDIAVSHGKKVLLDVNGHTLKDLLNHEGQSLPYLIKPNIEEMAQLFNVKDQDNHQEIINALKSPLLSQIPCVMISLGSKGALYKYQHHIYKVNIPKIKAVNAVGSGDSSIAGFSYGLIHKQDVHYAVKSAMAAGIANTLEQKTGFLTKENFEYYLAKIKIEQLECF